MLKLQYFGHLMHTDNSLEKSLMLGKIEGRRRKGGTVIDFLFLGSADMKSEGNCFLAGKP